MNDAVDEAMGETMIDHVYDMVDHCFGHERAHGLSNECRSLTMVNHGFGLTMVDHGFGYGRSLSN